MRLRLTQAQSQRLRGYFAGLLTEVAFAAVLVVVAFVISLVAFMVWR